MADPHPEWCLTPLVLGPVDQPHDLIDERLLVAGSHELSGGVVLLDVSGEHGIEDLVRRERLVVALVRPELGGRRLAEHRSGDQIIPGPGVARLAQPVDEGLGHVLDHRESARRVSVERRVARGELALVACREDDPPEGVGQRHQDDSPDPGLDVLGGETGEGPAQAGLQHLEQRGMSRLDRNRAQLDAEMVGQRGGVRQGGLAREP